MNKFCLSAGQSEKKAMNERGGKNKEGGTGSGRCFLLKILLVAAAFEGISGIAEATPTLYLSATGLPGSYTAVAADASGTVQYQGSAGTWVLVLMTGFTKPYLGSAVNVTSYLSMQAQTLVGGSLYIGFADTSYTAVGGITAVFTGVVVSGAPETVSFKTFADISNTQPTTTLPTGSVVTSFSGNLGSSLTSTNFGALPGTMPNVLGSIVAISTSGASAVSINASFAKFAGPITLGISLTNGVPLVQLTAATNFTYRIQSSTNFVDWTTTTSLLNTNGTVRFADSAGTNSPAKFYRAVTP